MTTKRFTIQGRGISDHKKKRLYDLQTIDGFISVRDELNNLHEENQSLKKELFEARKECLWLSSDEVDRVLYFENEVKELAEELDISLEDLE